MPEAPISEIKPPSDNVTAAHMTVNAKRRLQTISMSYSIELKRSLEQEPCRLGADVLSAKGLILRPASRPSGKHNELS